MCLCVNEIVPYCSPQTDESWVWCQESVHKHTHRLTPGDCFTKTKYLWLPSNILAKMFKSDKVFLWCLWKEYFAKKNCKAWFTGSYCQFLCFKINPHGGIVLPPVARGSSSWSPFYSAVSPRVPAATGTVTSSQGPAQTSGQECWWCLRSVHFCRECQLNQVFRVIRGPTPRKDVQRSDRVPRGYTSGCGGQRLHAKPGSARGVVGGRVGGG